MLNGEERIYLIKFVMEIKEISKDIIYCLFEKFYFYNLCFIIVLFVFIFFLKIIDFVFENEF